MSSNVQRAFWAESCLEHFSCLTGENDTADGVTDLIANLGHYCQASGLDFLRCVRTAIGHWHVEQADPEFFGPLPEVTISINESSTDARH